MKRLVGLFVVVALVAAALIAPTVWAGEEGSEFGKQLIPTDLDVVTYASRLRIDFRATPTGGVDRLDVLHPLPIARFTIPTCCAQLWVAPDAADVQIMWKLAEFRVDFLLYDQSGRAYRIPKLKIQSAFFPSSISGAESFFSQLVRLVARGGQLGRPIPGLEVKAFPLNAGLGWYLGRNPDGQPVFGPDGLEVVVVDELVLNLYIWDVTLREEPASPPPSSCRGGCG